MRVSKWTRLGDGGALVFVLGAALVSSACSLRSMAVNAIVPTLANPDVYLSEEDPELVRDALPFLLKTIESILDTSPGQDQALVFACTGFTLYGNAFTQVDAEIAEWNDDYERSLRERDRTWRLYVRARDYCLRSLELKYNGIADQLRQDPVTAVAVTEVEDVEVLYLLSAAWGLAISNALDQPELVADLPAVRALLARALELDEDYDRGSLHSALITLEALPEYLGGSPERAREHFERAVELSDGLDAAPFVTLASGVSVAAENSAEFRRLLEQALAIDPDEDTSRRLLNLVNQKRAQALLDHIDDLFFDPVGTEESLP
jgi:predicted anti-sigma-YlaC factor YlaD